MEQAINHYQVDRIEGEWAVVLDGQREVSLPLSWFNTPVKEGDGVSVGLEITSSSSLSDEIGDRLTRLSDKANEEEGNISL